MSYTATQVGDAYEAILRVAPPGGLTGAYDVSVAAQINNGDLTLGAYETSLINSDQALYTTEPAMVVYDAFYNTMPSSALLTTIATSTSGTIGNALPLPSPSNTIYFPAAELHNLGYSDANVWTILGADFASDQTSSFYHLYGGMNQGTTLSYTTFIDAVYQHEFGFLPSATNLQYLLNDIPGLSQLLSGGGNTATPLQIMGGIYGYLLYAGETNNVGIFANPTSAMLTALATDEVNSPGSSAPLYNGELVNEMAIVVDVTNGGTPTATEGIAVTFQITSTNVAAGTVLSYTLSGVTASEVVGGQLTGTVTVGAHGTASIPVVLSSTPGEGLTGPLAVTLAAVPNESITSVNTASVALTETQTTYTLTDTAPSPTTEGSTVIFHLATNGIVPAGETVAYTLSGVTASEVVGGQLTGIATVVNGVANIPVTLNSVPGEGLGGHLTATLSLPSSANAASVGTASVALTETAATYAITNSGNINEGSAETFNIHTNMPAGTVDSWALSGAAVGQVTPPVSGTVTFDVNGNASVTVGTTATVINGASPEALTFTLSANAQPVGTSTVQVTEATATLNDTNSHAISEGSTANFTLATANLANGTQLSYTLSGAGVAQLADPTQTTGTLTVSGNAATLNVATLASMIDTNGATAPLTLTLNGVPGAGATDTVTVNENATIAVSAGTGGTIGTAVTEGNSVTFNVTASSNVPVGTLVSYTLSGAALGNVLPALQTGTATVSPGGLVTVTIPTLADDSSDLVKGLTLTLNNLTTPSATDYVNENVPGVFVLTTGTDNGAGPVGLIPPGPFYGNPAGDNQYYATQATLGQNDVLNAGGAGSLGNTLHLTTSGFFSYITSFSTANIQTFDINANGATLIDMSSTVGVTTVIDDNSSASLTLANVQAPVELTILNPSFLGVPTNVVLQYIASAVPAGGATQDITLVNSLNPLTGTPSTSVTANGMTNFNIASEGGATNGLTMLASNVLTSVVFTSQGWETPPVAATASFVLGSGAAGPTAMAFANVGTDVLNLSAWNGVFYDIGNTAPAITSASGLTIDGGLGGMNSQFTPAPFGSPTLTGGGITTAGLLTINMGTGSFLGQQLVSTGGGITIDGTSSTTPAGFLNNGGQATTILTSGHGVSIQGFTGGLGGAGATIMTNGGSVGTGGSVSIGTNQAVTGGINESITTAGATHGGVVNVDLSANNNYLWFSSLDAHVAVAISGGTNTLDFSGTGTTGFHAGNGYDINPDTVYATGGTNTLVLDPQLLGGLSYGVQTIDFNTGNMTSAGGINMYFLDETGIVQTINVNDTIGATPALSNMTSTDVLNMNSVATYSLNTGFTTNNAFLFLDVEGGSTVTVTNTYAGSLGTLNFTVFDSSTTLNISDDAHLTTLGLFDTYNSGGYGDYLYVDAVATNHATITTVNGGTDNANIDMSLLAPDLSTVGGNITLGNGDDTVVVSNISGSGFDGSWTITAGTGDNSITVTPQYGDYDVINAGLGGSGDNDIYVNGQGGIVDIHTGNGDNTVTFDQTFLNLTDNDTLSLGSGYNTVTIINGAVNLNDSIFLNWTGVDQLNLAAGFQNSLILDVLANANAQSDSYTFEIQTGGNSLLHPGSTVIDGGTGYTSDLDVQVASGGDAGGDTILFNHVTNGYLTVYATVTDYNTSFESAPLTIQGTPEGIFANSSQGNELDLTADNNFAIIDALGLAGAGMHGVQSIYGEFNGYGTGMSVVLNNTATAAGGVNYVDLSDVWGQTTIWAQGVTNHAALTLVGGGNFSGADTIMADNGADTMVANSVVVDFGPPTIDNFLVSGGGANQMYGVEGYANTGTAFIFDTLASLLANGSIENYHTATDAIFVPTASVQAANVAIPGSLATSGVIHYVGSVDVAASAGLPAIYTAMDALLATPFAGGPIQAVYDSATGQMYLDIANQVVFNANTVSFAINFESPAGLTDLSTAQLNSYAATSDLFFNGTNVVPDLQIGGADITVAQWDFFSGQGVINAAPGGGNTATFDGPGGTLTTSSFVANYDFSGVTTPMSVYTPAFGPGIQPVMGPGTIYGSYNGDSFFVNSADLFNGLIIDGGSGANQITIDPVGPLVITLSATTYNGTTGEVQNVQTLNLVDSAGNTVHFANDGTAFAHINASSATGADVIYTAYMAQDSLLGDSITLANTAGDTVYLAPGAVADGTPAATIDFSGLSSAENYVISSVGGVINTIIEGGGHTTLELMSGDDISTATLLTGIDTLNIANGASIFLTGPEWNGFALVTSGDGAATVNFVGNEVVSTAPALWGVATYELGGLAGTSNTLTLENNDRVLGVYVPGGNVFSGTIDGGAANDTVVVGALALGGPALLGGGPATIDLGAGTNYISVSSGANLDPAFSGTTIGDTGGTTFLEITGSGAATVTMSNLEYQLFETPGPINTGSTSGDTVVFTDTDGVSNYTLDANILNWDLANGSNSYTLGAADQNVTGGTGADNINVGDFAITGTLALHGGANVIDASDGADLSGGSISVSGGGHVILHFNGSGVDHVTMTSGQEHYFDAASTGGAMTSDGGVANVINITDAGSHVVLDVNENGVVGTVNLQASGTTVDLSVGASAATASSGWDAHTLGIGNALTNELVKIDNGASVPISGTNDFTHYDTITGFVPGTLTPVDQLHLSINAATQVWYEAIATTGVATAAAANTIITIDAAVGELNAGVVGTVGQLTAVETLVAHALGLSPALTAGDNYTFIMSAPEGSAIYAAHASGADSVDGVQLIGLLSNLASDTLVAHNFV